MAVKVYSTMSGRRAMSDIRSAEAQGLLDKMPSVASCWRYMDKPEMKELLQELIERSALPLASVETHFSPDSSGFASKTYVRWFDKKWGKEVKEAQWVKCHIMSGAKTNIVVAADVTSEASNDSPFLIPFLNTAAKHFDIQEVSADKAYLSKENYRAIEGAGATALIPFKVNSVAHNPKQKRDRVWERAFHFFNLHRDEFLSRYHLRSNVETAFSMIKAKFGASVRGKNPAAQVNETLVKILCHNIVVLIHEMYELGISPTFSEDGASRLDVGTSTDSVQLFRRGRIESIEAPANRSAGALSEVFNEISLDVFALRFYAKLVNRQQVCQRFRTSHQYQTQ